MPSNRGLANHSIAAVICWSNLVIVVSGVIMFSWLSALTNNFRLHGSPFSGTKPDGFHAIRGHANQVCSWSAGRVPARRYERDARRSTVSETRTKKGDSCGLPFEASRRSQRIGAYLLLIPS